MSRHGLSETATRVYDITLNAWLNIEDLDTAELAAQYVAVRTLADAEIAAGLRALPILAALDARHQPQPWRGSSTGYVCGCGQGAHPCPDRLLLDGQRIEVAS